MDKNRGTLHFFAGHSHSGKSTKARKLGEERRSPVLSIDHWINVITQDGEQVFSWVLL